MPVNEIMNPRLVTRSQIDPERWDQVISGASNGRVYARSWYLDRVSEDWQALVWGDYAYVMPLPVRKKWGLTQLVQPCYCQQLGIFPSPPDNIAMAFLDAVRRHFRYVRISLNSQNSHWPTDHLREMKNFILYLEFPYTGLYAAYSTHTQRHIRKADKNGLTFADGIALQDYLDFKTTNQSEEIYGKCLPDFKKLASYILFEGKGSLVGVYNRSNELCAAAFFVFDERRIVYLNGVSSQAGREAGAMYFLMDHVIRMFAGHARYLDMEGSMIPGIARFFEGFGSHPETYIHWVDIRLPAPFKWLVR
jgi:hypothetical protein